MASSPSLRRAKMMMMMMVPPLSMHPIIILAIDVAQSVGVGRLGVAPRESRRRRRRRSARHFFVLLLCLLLVVFFRSFCRVVSKAMILYISVDIIGEKKVTTSCIALSLVSNSRYSYYMFFSSSVLQFFFEL